MKITDRGTEVLLSLNLVEVVSVVTFASLLSGPLTLERPVITYTQLSRDAW